MVRLTDAATTCEILDALDRYDLMTILEGAVEFYESQEHARSDGPAWYMTARQILDARKDR